MGEEVENLNLVDFLGIDEGIENTNYLIKTSRDRYILKIFENRVNKKNALDSKMIEDLALCTDYANFNDSIRAVIYKSIGDTFCSGLDLNDFKESALSFTT